MRKLGFGLIGAAGLAVSLFATSAYALTCTTTTNITTTTSIADSALGTGQCVHGGDKTFGGFNFSTLNQSGGSVLFTLPATPVGTYSLTFTNATPQNTTVNGFGFEVAVDNPAAELISTLQKDMTVNANPNPTGAGTATLHGMTNVAGDPAQDCTRTVNPSGGNCPQIHSFANPVADLITTENLTTGTNAQVTAVQDTISQITPTTSTPEPASLALLGAALVGFGVVRRRRVA